MSGKGLRGEACLQSFDEPRSAGRTLCYVAGLGRSVCDKIAARTVWNLLSSCDHSKNTGRPFFSQRVGWEGVGDTCSDGLVLQCAGGVRKTAVSLFFFFLANQAWSGTVGPRANCCHFFFPRYSLFSPRFYRVCASCLTRLGVGSEKRLYRCFVYLCVCVCVCGLGSNLSHCPQNVVNGCVVGCVI